MDLTSSLFPQWAGDYIVEHRRINVMIQNSEEGGDLGVVVNDYTRDFEYHSFANGMNVSRACMVSYLLCSDRRRGGECE